MYTYYAETVEDLVSITSGLLKQGIGFRAFFDHGKGNWTIELTGAF